MKNRKSILSFLIKFIISSSILVFLLTYQTSLRDILGVLKEVNLFWLGFSFSLHALGLLISAVRWQILIQALGEKAPLGFLVKSYLVGTFFNNFLPTRIGGDVVRIWDGSRYSQTLVRSSAIILVERWTGMSVLLLFAVLASLIRMDMAQKIPIIWVSLLLGSAGILLSLTILFPFTGKWLQKIPEKGVLARLKEKIFNFRETIFIYKNKPIFFSKALFWAFLLQVNVILHYFLIGKALGLTIHLLDYFIFIPIVYLILIIPVTINGLGLREGSYIEIFRFYGILPKTAFSFSLIDLAFGLIIGIAGGIIYTTRK